MIACYVAELRKLRCAGVRASEVGPNTWFELCCSLTPQQEISETIEIQDLTFMGVRVRKNDNVPEGRFWPLHARALK
jgi:hypothetical protein